MVRSVVEPQRDIDREHVFTFRWKRITRMMTRRWKLARARVGMEQVRVHDLKHTFGRRLRAAGVSFEDRQDLLGHRSGRKSPAYERRWSEKTSLRP